MSFFESASLVFISDFAAASASMVSGSGTNTGKAYNIKPVEELGSELVTNGTFDTDSDWTVTNVGGSNGWRIADGRAICDTVNPSSGRNLNSSTSLVSGKSYKVTLDILQSADELEILVGSTLIQNAFPIGTTIGASYIIDSSQHSGGTFSIYGGSSDLQEIDNVSVKEVISQIGDFDFERGSDITATRVNSSGLIEKGRGNFLLQSNQFDTTWSNIGSGVNPNQAGYDGSSDAWLLRETTANSQHYIRQSSGIASGIGTFSFYAKKKDYDYIQFARSGDGGDYANFNISNGTLGNSTGVFIDKNIVSVGNGWYRCSVTYSIGSGAFVGIAIIRSDISARYDTYAGDTTKGTYIQDAQLEQGLVATDYIETTTTEPLRAGILEDEPRFDYYNSASSTPNTCPSLLLEPSRDNLITNSEYIDSSTDWTVNNITVEDNSITSPENQINAAKLTGTGGNAQRRIYQSFSQVSGSDFTTSIFAKEDTENILFLRLYNTTDNVYANASFNLSTGVIASNASGTAKIENYGNGWYRCILTGTPSTTTTTGGAYFNLTDDGNTTSTTSLYLWGAQLEEGSYPTSYIPTYGTAATRGADYSESSTSLSIGDSEFCAYYEMDAKAIPRESSAAFFRIEFGSNSHYIGLKGSSNSINNMYTLQTLGNYSETIGNITESPGVVKFLINYSSGTGDLFINSTKYAGVISGPTTGNTITNIELRGSGYAHDSKQILLFPEALSEDECITLTT